MLDAAEMLLTLPQTQHASLYLPEALLETHHACYVLQALSHSNASSLAVGLD